LARVDEAELRLAGCGRQRAPIIAFASRRYSRILLPDEEGVDDLFRLYALLARFKGQTVTSEDVHDASSLWMLRQDDDHSSLNPQRARPSTRREDRPFADAIRDVAAAGA
jgi:hypothetical protein